MSPPCAGAVLLLLFAKGCKDHQRHCWDLHSSRPQFSCTSRIHLIELDSKDSWLATLLGLPWAIGICPLLSLHITRFHVFSDIACTLFLHIPAGPQWFHQALSESPRRLETLAIVHACTDWVSWVGRCCAVRLVSSVSGASNRPARVGVWLTGGCRPGSDGRLRFVAAAPLAQCVSGDGAHTAVCSPDRDLDDVP